MAEMRTMRSLKVMVMSSTGSRDTKPDSRRGFGRGRAAAYMKIAVEVALMTEDLALTQAAKTNNFTSGALQYPSSVS
jgi:hypothetical protein